MTNKSGAKAFETVKLPILKPLVALKLLLLTPKPLTATVRAEAIDFCENVTFGAEAFDYCETIAGMPAPTP